MIEKAHGNIHDKYRDLENIKADEFFDQISVGNDDIKTDHHQHDHYPEIVLPQDILHL